LKSLDFNLASEQTCQNAPHFCTSPLVKADISTQQAIGTAERLSNERLTCNVYMHRVTSQNAPVIWGLELPLLPTDGQATMAIKSRRIDVPGKKL
jgi:hypothetical protein